MKKTLTALVLTALCTTLGAKAQDLNLIPQPLKTEITGGEYTFRNFAIGADTANREVGEIAALLGSKLSPATGITPAITRPGKGEINLRLADGMAPEAYTLSVGKRGVEITASTPAGLFYGTQSMLQLLPKEIKGSAKADIVWRAPRVEIEDSPRFPWRGMMLDVSRHFFTKQEVMAYIDQMAEYKMNRFHWHLTDDQGWRIEIESLPRLTQIGAWRAERVGDWWGREVQRPGEEATYGGFYTKEDVAEVLEYARRRYVTVIPEIDVPGHSVAALVAYPELACMKAPESVGVGNKFYTIDENSLCIGSPKTMEYMAKIFTEVAAMFPSEYIHIGGDECFKGFWSRCPKCTKLMVDQGIKDVNELQSYFIRQMESLLKKSGRKIIGWDEIHEGGLAPEATVMSWRGMQGGILAAKQGHHVIMTPDNHCYIDLYQGEPSVEPETYSMCRLSDSYRFEPVPDGINPELIIGGQGNLWAEAVPTFRHAQYMSWPRGWALSEVLWSDTTRRDWSDFVGRVERHFERADCADINYARSMYNAIVNTTLTTSEADSSQVLTVELSSELPDMAIYYSWDNTVPDHHSARYTEPLGVPLNASRLKVMTYRDGKPVGQLIKLDVKDLKARAKVAKRVVGNL